MFFVLAFTLAMNLYNQSKQTMDTVMYSVDRTNYYQHVGATNTNITRQVGIETIIPTLYTYVTNSDNSVRINIVDGDNELVQVFDAKIEGLVNQIAGRKDSETTSTPVYKRYNTIGRKLYMYGAPWAGNIALTVDRINAYVYGDDRYIGTSQLKVKYKSDDNYLLKLAGNGDGRFTESYVEYQNSGRIYWDEDYQESLVQLEGTVKTIITYQKIK